MKSPSHISPPFRKSPPGPCAFVLAGIALILLAGPLPPAAAAPGPRPTPVNPVPVPTGPRVSLAGRSLPVLIACLGDARQQVRSEAARRLKALPRKQVLDAAATMAGNASRGTSLAPDFQLFSPQSVALGVLMEWNDPRAAGIALRLVDSSDPDVRERAGLAVAGLEDARALPFLVRALRTWGDDNTAGLRSVFRGLDHPGRMADANVQAALLEHLQSRIPAPDPKGRFHYSDAHEPPQEGDLRRCWLYKTDACLSLVTRYPFPQARVPVERCLDLPEVRAAAALALAQIACQATPEVRDEAARTFRRLLGQERDTERLLAFYRALFMVKGDNEQDRLTAREMFTATVAPTPAWVQGLGAMVALFEARTDEPALRVVSLWRLKGTAARMRAAALDAMRQAHPEAYQRLLPPGYEAPTRP